MSQKLDLITSENVVEKRILLIREQRVMLDTDLAALYGVTTKRLNEQVKRNKSRFPDEFMFQLTPSEKTEVVANCDHLKKVKYSNKLPFAFTEHGALMLANVLNSPRAVEVSVFVVRAFIRLREMLRTHKELSRKFEELERHVQNHDESIETLFEAIRQLMAPLPPKSSKIGF